MVNTTNKLMQEAHNWWEKNKGKVDKITLTQLLSDNSWDEDNENAEVIKKFNVLYTGDQFDITIDGIVVLYSLTQTESEDAEDFTATGFDNVKHFELEICKEGMEITINEDVISFYL